MISLGCSTQVPNVEVCIELPSGGAFCKYTLKDIERRIPVEEWDTLSTGRLSMTPEAFGEYQKFIEGACLRVKCTEEERKAQKKLLEVLKNVQ